MRIILNTRIRFIALAVLMFFLIQFFVFLNPRMLYAESSCDAQTVLMAHMDGTDASTTFTDDSASAHTLTANGNAQIDTAQSKFGGASGLFDGNDAVTAPSNADFAMGTGDFTIDFWIRFNTLGVDVMLTLDNTGDAEVMMRTNGSTELAMFMLGTAYTFTTWSLATNTWFHVAVTRSGTDLRGFIDGTQLGAAQTASENLTQNGLVIGASDSTGSSGVDGWIEEVRISKGIARWTGNFTPPTAPYCPPSAARDLNVNKAVSVTGNVTITATLTKGSGTFAIDHPLDPENKILYHSFVESPDVLNVYDGVSKLDENGEVTVELPSYFEALNTNVQYFVQSIGAPAPNLYVKREVKNNTFVIAGGVPGGEVSWQVTGVRHDPYILANPIVIEVEKGENTLVARGEFLHPELYERNALLSLRDLFYSLWNAFRPLF